MGDKMMYQSRHYATNLRASSRRIRVAPSCQFIYSVHQACPVANPSFLLPFFDRVMSNFAPSPSDATSIATIRTLAADVVGKANSGHPGQSVVIRKQIQCIMTPCPSRCSDGHGPCDPCPLHPVINVILLGFSQFYTSSTFLRPDSSMPIQRNQSGSTVIVSCFPTGMLSSAIHEI
jgi:hypothetical protein